MLLASADFNDWWVVADRRFSYPQPFWRARTAEAGHAYTYTTDTCIAPPATADSISNSETQAWKRLKLSHDPARACYTLLEAPGGHIVQGETTSGQYVLACVVWKPSSFATLETMTELLGEDGQLVCACTSTEDISYRLVILRSQMFHA